MHYLMGRYGVSQRRAARAARFWRSSLRYESRREPLTMLRQRMRELAQARVRFGYRRVLVMMGRSRRRAEALTSTPRAVFRGCAVEGKPGVLPVGQFSATLIS